MSLFYLCRILIIAELSAHNTIMDHAKEKNMEKLINNAPFALVLVLLVIGFILLIKGADFFVEGSSSVAKRLHVPSIIIGLTIVAMGTSLPETAVSVSASITGNNELAVSNVVGSNIFNLMVVIGVCAMIATVEVARETIRRDIPLSLICAGLLLLLGIIGIGDQTNMTLGHFDGVIFIGLFAGYIFYMIRIALKANKEGKKVEIEGGSDEDVEQAEPDDEMARQAFALPDEPEADAVEYQVDEIEDVREFQLVAAFDQERQQRDGDDDVECKEELEDPHEAELLRVAEVFRHGLRLQSRATDLSWWRASPMALRAQFVQYISADRRKARSERQMPRSLRRTRRSCRYQRLSVGSRAPMNETASSRVMWHDSAMNGAQRSISSSSVSSSRNAPFA